MSVKESTGTHAGTSRLFDDMRLVPAGIPVDSFTDIAQPFEPRHCSGTV